MSCRHLHIITKSTSLFPLFFYGYLELHCMSEPNFYEHFIGAIYVNPYISLQQKPCTYMH